MIDYQRYRQKKLISSLNLTPFTDVVLVLLIVFMISAPGMLSSVLPIHLPRASSGDPGTRKGMVIGLEKGGELYLNGEAVTSDQLQSRLQELAKEKNAEAITLQADSRTEHGRVVEILDMVRKAGLDEVSVGTIR